MMRLRQVVIAARDLDATVADLTAVLGIRVGFNDPGVAEFGLVNAVMPVGDTFLEVVSPVSPSAPARRFIDRRGGDGGYMVMIQSSDLDADRRRVADLGVRVAWQIDLHDIRGTHLHPADVGGAILSLDQPEPAPSWRWGGPKWKEAVRTDVTRAVTGVELASDDPERLAAQWARVLGRGAERAAGDLWVIALDQGGLSFAHGDRPGPDRIQAYEIAADGARVLAAAEARGVTTGADSVTIAGTTFRFADA
jgi:catechol 2,3-dioxygenase-like lactoylglutathione lyase family enzyme